jgi:hypothetical protein
VSPKAVLATLSPIHPSAALNTSHVLGSPWRTMLIAGGALDAWQDTATDNWRACSVAPGFPKPPARTRIEVVHCAVILLEPEQPPASPWIQQILIALPVLESVKGLPRPCVQIVSAAVRVPKPHVPPAGHRVVGFASVATTSPGPFCRRRSGSPEIRISTYGPLVAQGARRSTLILLNMRRLGRTHLAAILCDSDAPRNGGTVGFFSRPIDEGFRTASIAADRVRLRSLIVASMRIAVLQAMIPQAIPERRLSCNQDRKAGDATSAFSCYR